MKLVYGVTPANALWVVGSAQLSQNGLALHFQEDAFARMAAGQLRGFLLVAARALGGWPVLPADLTGRPLEAKVWAAPLDTRPNRRTLLWQGWPIGWPDRPGLALLRPEIPVGKLIGFELKQSGFLELLKDEQGRVLPPTVEAVKPMTEIWGSLYFEPVPKPPTTWLPPWVLERSGPSPRRARVRITTESTGYNFTSIGDVFEAEVCPTDALAVWIRRKSLPDGYRLKPGMFEEVRPKRRARSLDSL